jgi:hypothetical protein
VAEVVSIKAQKILIIISNSQKFLKNFLNFLIANLFYKKIENILKKNLKMDHGKTRTYQKILIQKNLL